MTTDPQTDRRARIVAAIKSSPFEELRTVDHAPNGPLQITAKVDDLADAVLAALPDTARLHDQLLTQQAELAQLRGLLRTENGRANSAIDRETTTEEAEKEQRLAVSAALGLGTGATWEAIRDRAEDLTAEVEELTEARVRQMEAAVLNEAAGTIAADAALRETEGEYALAEYGYELARLIRPKELRRMAVEAQQQTETPADRAALSARLWAVAEHHIVAEWICCEPLDPTHQLCAKGYAALEMAKSLLVDSDPEEAWNPAAPLLDAVLAELRAAAVPAVSSVGQAAHSTRGAVLRSRADAEQPKEARP